MPYTQGLVIRCPNCGALNVISGPDYYNLVKCLSCEGTICPGDVIVYKSTGCLIA